MSEQATNDRFLNISEAAKLLGMAKGTLYNWVSEQKIPHYHFNGALRFSCLELGKFIASSRTATVDEVKKLARA